MQKKPSLHLGRLRKLAIEVYKITSKESPNFLSNMFTKKEFTHNLRDQQKVHQPSYNTMTYGYNSLRYQGAKLWNMLPYTLKEVTDLKHFKSLISTWLGPSCSCSMCSLCKFRSWCNFAIYKGTDTLRARDQRSPVSRTDTRPSHGTIKCLSLVFPTSVQL